MGDVLAFHARRMPGGPALTQDGITITFAELDARASARAAALAARDVDEGEVVVLRLPNDPTFFEATFALWKLGATPCPVSPAMPAVELEAILEVVRPSLVVGEAVAHLPQWSFAAVGGENGTAVVQPTPSGRIAPHWKALTSGGSTGRPKIIVAHSPSLIDPAKAGYALQRAGETVLNPGPLYHNAAFSAAHHCLFAGGHVINMARFDPEQCLQLIERHRVGHVVMVPTMMHRIWRLPENVRRCYDLSSLRVLVHLAAPCPAWLKEAWIDWLGPDRIFEVYAGTEGLGATCIAGAEWLAHRGSVGRVVGENEMAALREDGSRCAPGELGEIHFRPLKGDAQTFSYLGDETPFRQGWRSLGDVGHLDADGYLYLADRRTDLIVSGGANVYPREVEAALDHHPDVRTSVVVGLPDDDLGHRVHAIVQVAPDAAESLSGEALAAFLADRLTRYKIPRSFEIVDHDLRDEAGKVRRGRLRDERVALSSQSSA